MNPDTGKISQVDQETYSEMLVGRINNLIPIGATRPDDTQEKTSEAAESMDAQKVLKIINEWASIGGQRNEFTLHKKLNLIFALLTLKYQI